MRQMKHRMKKGVWMAFAFPLFVGALFLFTWLVMLLWNAVLPAAVPTIKAIGFWQAMGILVLSKILFGFNKGWGGKRRMWKERMEEKWHTLTPEQKEKIKTEWKNRCGGKWRRQPEEDTSSTMSAE